ncbi:MAG: TRAP transporter large permease subunit [Betaproteobacteria bacterium]|nr:TRAP transporter large permease subunit [Betaproteobacteria bacterium]
MTWWVALSGGVGLLLALLLLGVPIFVAFLLLNVAGILAILGPAGFGMFANSIYATGTISALAAVPLFILMGEILFRSGAMEVLLDSMDTLVGKIRGRQYVLCILLSAILGALSGAAMAVAGLLGRSLLPTMLKRGYDKHLSAGTLLAGASLDPIIPPSVLAILIATIAQISTGKLLIAGIVPGLLLTGMFLVYVLIRVKLNPQLAPELAIDLAEGKAGGSMLMALVKMLPSALIFFLVMGLVMLGVATPTESAATGVFGALLLAKGYKKLSWGMVRESLMSSVTVASLLLLVMCCAVMFSQLLTLTGAARNLGEVVVALKLSPAMMLIIMIGVPFVLFMFLDQVALMLVLIPIYNPLLKVYGFDEIWFYTLFLVVATVGGLSPPFGYTLFALKSAAPTMPMSDIFKAAWPFVWIMMLGLLIMAVFPPLVTWLPNLMSQK